MRLSYKAEYLASVCSARIMECDDKIVSLELLQSLEDEDYNKSSWLYRLFWVKPSEREWDLIGYKIDRRMIKELLRCFQNQNLLDPVVLDRETAKLLNLI